MNRSVLLIPVLTVFIGFHDFADAQGVDLPPATGSCHRITSESNMPQTTDFAPPYDLFSAARELVLQTACKGGAVRITAGKADEQTLVYKNGYIYRNGNWEEFSFTGSSHSVFPNWFLGTAVASTSTEGLNLASDNFVLAHTCRLAGNEWKCGCRDATCSKGYWQLQVFGYKQKS